ncbi:MAG: efflux RND transporter periplasmic adaptor subunit [Anaerolineales bacterium]|nr:efflux RND transporter periplasmic adaptor subunit [Anaerolineales bacterium]
MKLLKKSLPLFLLFFVSLAACDALPAAQNAPTALTASGVVETVQVVAAPEVAGRVAEVFVKEGDTVKVGDPLLRLEGDLLDVERKQAVAAVDSAQAGLELAQTNLTAAQTAREVAQTTVDAAHLQVQQVLAAAQLAELPTRAAAWNQDQPEAFTLPVWYFEKSEKIAAAQSEMEDASAALETERKNFHAVIESASNADLTAAETRLANAQSSFLIAQQLLDKEIAQNGSETISSYVQDIYDSAKAELDAAQLAYDQMLSTQATTEVLEARARLAVAEERYSLALDQLNSLLTGEDSLVVQAAQLAVTQAEDAVTLEDTNIAQAQAAVAVAQTGVAQAQAALDAVDVQIGKLTLNAAVAGVVMVRNIEPGEILSPGMSAFTIGELDHLTITVYIPEDRYGEVTLNEHASVAVDSFPGQTFEAVVTRIADQAEFTPRNVQTQEERSTTVFAIELAVTNMDGRLKPGMPADVTFGP